MKEDLLKIITHYGLENQKRKLVEEVYELLDALAELTYSSMNFSNNLQKMLEHVTEEIADVQVLLEQIKIYWSIEPEDIQRVMEYKINRTLGGIDEKLLRSTTRTRSSEEQAENIKGEETTIF